jgi:2-keto-3-deoxy-L-rhamnonate aldolase RhmA
MNQSSFLGRVTNKIASGHLAMGAVVNGSDPAVTEILATCGFDFLWIDMEHSVLDKAEVNRHIVAARSQSVAPFVRVPWNDPVLVKPILEMGPAGIIFPFVKSSEDAARAVASCRYPPAGIRGFGPQRANMFGAVGLDDYLATAANEPWVIVQIEHVDAVRNLAEICAVPGVNSLVVGPFDLSASVGKPGQIRDPEVIELADEIGRVARENNMTLGAFSVSTDEVTVRQWIDRGAGWLALDTDYGLIARSAAAAIDTVTRLWEGNTPAG